MSKMSDIQKALEQTTTARVPTPLTVPEMAPPALTKKPNVVALSRQGRVHIGAYLPADFKRGIRMLQATTGEDLQSILARVLNEQFRLHNLPEVGQD
jgi:hypothetical protein